MEKFKNPVLRGMYPDPSMCAGPDGKFYLVCSSFQYFPGVPLFESDDLINWKQIGHCLTRKSQLLLEKNNTNSGIYAPTIRYNNGRFYMVVTNVENIGNFYVYTDDIHGEWSDPVIVEQSGIDPSLFFDDDGKVYFISNGNDREGRGFIQMSEIDITNGKKITENEPLWYGTGGRFIEAPHMYKFGDYYYLLNAEGGTEYGHMVNYARSKNVRGPFEPFPNNPVLTNRNLGGYSLQGAGHGDIVQARDGTWWFCHLAFRQIDMYMPFHHLGRETCMEPVIWKDDWFFIGTENIWPGQTACGSDIANGYNEKIGYGKALLDVECPSEIKNHKAAEQNFSYTKNFGNLDPKLDWCFLCNPDEKKYRLGKDAFILTSGDLKIDTYSESPTFIGIRQCEFTENIRCHVEITGTEEIMTPGNPQSGITVYMDPNHHYDLYIEKKGQFYSAVCRMKIGPVSEIKGEIALSGPSCNFCIKAEPYHYEFYINDKSICEGETRYLSSEVAGGFTGVFIGLFAQGGAVGKFTDFEVSHKE